MPSVDWHGGLTHFIDARITASQSANFCNKVYRNQNFTVTLVYRLRKIMWKCNFFEQFRKLIYRYKIIGYSLDIMRQTACLGVNPIIVDSYASLFNFITTVRDSDSMTATS